MLGCGGREVSIAVASFDFATDDGSVSGSKRAFNTRASFAERATGDAETAIGSPKIASSYCSWNGPVG
jgi:hypothetical protein